jgi:23S rRNA (cytosine1962-C5)-methyltransferase
MEIDPDLKAIADIPASSHKNIAIRVTNEAEKAILQGHPWVYEESITHQNQPGRPGDTAIIFNQRRKFLAAGLYDPHSFIRVRVLQNRKPAQIGLDLFREKISTANQRRNSLNHKPPERTTTGFRLVHGENDGLPGLVIDKYEETFVIKLYTTAWLPHLADVLKSLSNIQQVDRLVLRLSRSLIEKKEVLYGLSNGLVLYGPKLEGPVLFLENGLHFEADLVHGQKTGFFFDQRENRERVEKYTSKKTVLNLFSYTGGFSVYAARGGAKKITSVDSSRPALEASVRNFYHNRSISKIASAQHEILLADAFQALEKLGKNNQGYDVVIIDPPAFAQKSDQTAAALSAYQRLTTLGLNLLAPGGILVQASCSSRVEADAFFDAIHHAAEQTGRPLREIERTGHPLDHPVSFKEGKYLKCIFGSA